MKPLAKALLKKFGTFAEVLAAPRERLKEIDGLGDATVNELKLIKAAAATATARRGRASDRCSRRGRRCSTIAAPRWRSPSKEQFRILFLDKRNALIADEVQQTGTVDHTPVYPREVVNRALELSATAVILVHNHPVRRPDAVARRYRDDADRSWRSRARSASRCTTTSSSARTGTRA